MKVLVICHRVPFPPKRGGKIRPFNVVKHLHSKGHAVTVASLARTRTELQEADGLQQYCRKTIIEVVEEPVAWMRMVARIPTRVPSSFGYFWSPHLYRRIREESLAGNYDLVFVHCSSVAVYLPEARARLKIIDFGDMDSQKWREYSQHCSPPMSLAYWLEAVKLEARERQIASRFDVATCTTAAELQSLKELGAMGESEWFPNGVDEDYFQPGSGDYDPDLVTFVGRMDYFPNQVAVKMFCAEVLPRLRERRPTARFEIVGADPPMDIAALRKLSNVTVTGSVPDVRPFLRRAALTVAPLQIARGTQNKILESMSMGVPVVCSRAAAGGVDAVPGEHILVCDTVDDYVSTILGVLSSPSLRERLSSQGRARVLSKHCWENSMKRLDALIERHIRPPDAA